jgi:NADH-quinone oxidoreductase subunit N
LFVAAIKTGAPNLGLLWLVILAIALSAVSLYYYLQVLKQIYVADAPARAGALRPSALTQVALCFLAFAVLTFGCAPSLILHCLHRALHLVGY